MKKNIKGFTIIELLIGVALMVVILGGVLFSFIIMLRYFEDGVAMARSQATARIVIEKIVRPDIREGSSFSPPPPDGDILTVTKYDGSIDTFVFDNGDDNDDETFTDNTIKKNGNTIGTNIVKLPDPDNPGSFFPIFQEIEANERVEIKFGVKNEGEFDHDKEVHIRTEIKLRN